MAAVLCLAMAVSICCAFAGSAEAATSLPAIETIKSSQDTYTILEIVPSATQGSIGYYIDGQEPWVTLAGTKTSPALRKTFVDSSLRGLLNKTSSNQDNAEYNYSIQLVNPSGETASDKYPLNYVGGYTEVYPWVWATSPDGTYKGYKKMPLAAAENGTATGSMEYVGAGYGDYNIGDFEYVGPTGDCVQLVKGFKTDQVAGDVGYWYKVELSELKYDVLNSAPNLEAPKWCVIYEEVTSADAHDLTVGGKYYAYVGVVGERDFPGLDISKTYIMAKFGQPYKTKAEITAPGTNEYILFADTTGGFRDKETGETGYFSKISYEYVGDGNGAYAFTPSAGGTTYHVTTKYVYYKGGFTNNNWFLRYVFDYDASEISGGTADIPNINVNSVPAKNVTQKQIDAADMVVLNYGFNIEGTTFSGIFKNEFAADLPTADLVGSLGTLSKPVIFDYNLTGLTSGNEIRIKDAAQAILSKALTNRSGSGFNTSIEHTFVGGNIYCIDGTGWTTGSSDDPNFHAPLPLATVFFDTASELVGDHLKKSDAFYPVYEEIFYENFLRQIRKETEELNSKITMATSIRYIINFAKTRVADKKTTVRVLDIEPRTGAIEPAQKTKLAEWLGIPEANVIISTMSAAEFIGIKADISEDYDLLYIGDSVTGFNKTSGSFNVGGEFGVGGTTYNFSYITYKDLTMSYRPSSSESDINNDTVAEYIKNRQRASWLFNIQASDIVFGMRYTSVGDKVSAGSTYRLSGLLDRDYTENYTISKTWFFQKYDYNFGTVLNATDDTSTFRYSGNDLTEAAAKKITDFANSGYPVILADSLLQPPAIDDSTLTTAKAHISPILLTYSYAATPNLTVADSVLKVTLSSAGSLFYTISSANCQLYKNGEPAKDSDGNLAITTITPFRSASFNLSDYDYKTGDKFYCTVTISRVRYPLLPIFTFSANSDQVGKTSTVTMRGQAEPMFVDNSSVMYSTINSIVGKTNVMNWSSLTSTVTDIKQTLLARFVNLSKPTVQFWNNTYPTTYAMDANGVMNSLSDPDGDGVYNLTYAFKITNNADPYPDQTRYSCNLYLDLDGNGLFEENEVVTDVALRDWTVYSADYGTTGQRIENGTLKGSYGTKDENQHYYYLNYELPSTTVGILPWKIEVEDVSFFGGHDSVIDYTRVAPKADPEIIKVLQINSTASGNFNLQANIELTNGTYNTLFQKVSQDFKISITTIPASFNTDWTSTATTCRTSTTGSTGSTTANTLFAKTGATTYTRKTGTGTLETFDSLKKLLESYDMLIIGFGDSYQNLDYDTSRALADYINDGKPVLMTHDTLSFYSISDGNFLTSSSSATYFGSWSTSKSYVYGSGTPIFGYYSNMLLRDLIGVDRYGVTSIDKLSNGQTIGMSKYAGISAATDSSSSASANQLTNSTLRTYIRSLPGFSAWSGGYVPSATYYSGGATIDATRSTLLGEVSKAGYSVAWKAGKSRTQTVAETQGLTNAVLFRFTNMSVSDWVTGSNLDSYRVSYQTSDLSHLGLSKSVSQVNKGQITTYPYNINTAAFSGAMYDPKVANTMFVQETHAQNYQLNMNSENMIVWYCLSPDTNYGSGVYQKNDCMNAYYVYTCGNVTYTGSGHVATPATYSAGNINANNEAKLFINTMMAAYRAKSTGSKVSFSNEDGSVKGISDFFVVTDGDEVLSLKGPNVDSARKVYFTINDSNVDAAKVMTATFSYESSGDLELTVYNADTDQAVYTYGNATTGSFVNGNTTLESTHTYYVKLDDLFSAIKNYFQVTTLSVTDLNKNLTVTLSTTLSTNPTTPTTTTAKLNLKQYRLFDLS